MKRTAKAITKTTTPKHQSPSLELLDNSSLPIEQQEVNRSFKIKIEPTSALPQRNNQSAPITFDVPESSIFYTSASEIYLDLTWRCVHADGTPLDPNEPVSVINGSFFTQFRDIEVYCNNRQVMFYSMTQN
jgi:hypothetical protein